MLVISRLFVCKQEQHNIHDLLAMAVYKGSIIVGHVSQYISALFLEKLVSIMCKITGHKRYMCGVAKHPLSDFEIEKIRSFAVL